MGRFLTTEVPSLDAYAISAGLGACAKGARWQETLWLLQYLKHWKLGPPNAVGQSAALSALERSWFWQEVLALFQEFHQANGHGSHGVGAALSAMATGTQWKGALELWQHVQETLDLRSHLICRNALMTSLGRAARWQLSLHFLQDPNHRRLDAVAIGAAVNACQNATKWAQAIHMAIHCAGEGGNAAAFGAAMSSCERAAQWQAALSTLEVYKSSSVRLDESSVPTFNAAISACEKAGRWEASLAVLQDLVTLRLRRTAVSYNAAISACEREAQWPMAFQILAEKRSASMEVDRASFGASISAVAQASLWEICLTLVVNPEVVGGRPRNIDASSLSAAIMACQRANRWSVALCLHAAEEVLLSSTVLQPAADLFIALACEEVGRSGSNFRGKIWRSFAASQPIAAIDAVMAMEASLPRNLRNLHDGHFWQKVFQPSILQFEGVELEQEVGDVSGPKSQLSEAVNLGVCGTREALATLGLAEKSRAAKELLRGRL
eukprot:s40_g34.t1